ncbi:MAG: reverse transcriptase family protein, partial [Pseudomonadota bacterium]
MAPVNTENNAYCKLYDVDITLEKVYTTLKSLPIKFSEDHNGFSYAILKNGGIVLSTQITRLFKLSLSYSDIPKDWKKSVILPIRKKGSAVSTAEGFRPISITSCFCRTLERIIRNSVVEFLDRNDIINKSQHGFRQRRSTASALLSYANVLSSALDSGMCIDAAYFDFSKAFDSVRHDHLIQKLANIGIAGNLLSWIMNYLSDRSQVVKINSIISSEKQVTSGVIQGSVLGPLLFTIFVNDIDDNVNNCVLLKYADDIRIYRCFKACPAHQNENSYLFQTDVNALMAWSMRWDLKFNYSKCCILHFGRSNIRSPYKLNNHDLTEKKLEKDLGILFSVDFKFDDYIHLIAKKANKQLGLITKVFSLKNPQVIIQLYKTFVRPHLEYNSIIWSPYTKKNENIIEKIQKKLCNILYGRRSS